MAQAKDRTRIITTTWDDATQAVVFNVAGQPSLSFPLSQVSEANKARFMRHGIIQRVSDAAALERNTTDGQPATPEAKRAAMARLVEHYLTGTDDWSPAREGGTIGLDTIQLAAVCEVTGKGLEVIRAMVEAKAAEHKVTQKAYLARLAASAKVAPVVDRMRAAGAPDVDPDGELDAMMA